MGQATHLSNSHFCSSLIVGLPAPFADFGSEDTSIGYAKAG
jgi:hypothetical protein